MNLFQVFSNSDELAGNNKRLNYCPKCGANFIRPETFTPLPIDHLPDIGPPESEII